MHSRTLSLEQVASICGVSLNRVQRWIEKRGLQTSLSRGKGERVERCHLIDFLVQYNMPIPEFILPFHSKKILFVLSEEMADDLYIQVLLRFFDKLKKEANFIIDHVPYGSGTQMKLMVFKPDLVLLDTSGCEQEAENTARLIKQTEEFSAIKVITIMAAKKDKGIKGTILRNGVDAAVSRSIEIKCLIEKINSLL